MDAAAHETTARPLALVTGASSGIGLALAIELMERGHDVVVVGRSERIEDPALFAGGTIPVLTVRADLADPDGVQEVHDRVTELGRPVGVLALNAGIALGERFIDRNVAEHLQLVDLNVRSVVHLAGLVLPDMAERGEGRVLITSSIASVAPGPYQSTYNASKAFVQLFAQALREEMRTTGVTVTALMPGPTETEVFERGDLDGTLLGRVGKDDPRDVARAGLDALFAGKDQVIPGLLNRVGAAAGKVLPQPLTAAIGALISKPGSG